MTYANFRTNTVRALSEDELFRLAPSIFAVEKHESRSERFKAIPTIEVLRALEKEGFVPVSATQGNTRDASKRNFTKHAVRLRHIGEEGRKLQVGDTFFEVMLRNGNDGSASYDLNAALLRLACLNGMVASAGEVDKVRVRHTGDVTSKVIEGTFRVLGQADRVLGAVEDWNAIQLPAPAQAALAQAAHTLRFADSEGVVNTPIRAEQLLHTRRFEDRGNSLWQAFNVVQENVIRGGLTARNTTTWRRTTTREVKGIDDNIKLNQALWLVGEQLAETLRGTARAA